jgi:glycosyltransferase involved in cell wall biosynthesis
MYESWAGKDRTIVVPYGVDSSAIERYCSRVSRHDARADVGLPADARVILVMGTIEQRKAQTRIAQAFAMVAEDHPQWTLIFVGDTQSPYSDALKSFVRTCGLQERCRIMPVDKDAHRWYRSADVLLSASDMESLPRSMIETMYFGTPVLAAAVFGVPELLQDGSTGFLFEPNDLDALVDAISRVLALEPDELAKVGEAGRRHVVDHYDSSAYAAAFADLFEGLLRDPTETPGRILSHGLAATNRQS